MSGELKEIKDILEQYILYLKIGAFRQLSIKEDILLCNKIIKGIDEIFDAFNSKEVKNIYREYASFYRQILLLEKEININAVIQCEKVIKKPNYKNYKALEYLLSQMYANDKYDGVVAENNEQEKIHREMYRNIRNKIILLNLC